MYLVVRLFMDLKKILVPVNGEKADNEAVKLACNLAKKGKAKVYVLHVIEVERSLPVEANIEAQQRQAEEVIEHAERVAEEEADYQVETELLQAREAGPAIVDESVKRDIDLLVMGFSHKKRFGQFSFGDTLPYVLRTAPCRVLVVREPFDIQVEPAKKPGTAKHGPKHNGI